MSDSFANGLKELLPIIEASLAHSPVLVGGLLLHGPTGVGKSALAEAVLQNLPPHVSRHRLNCTGLFSKRVGSAEAKLLSHFDQLDKEAPSVCVVEDIDGVGLRGQQGVTAVRLLALFCRLVDYLRARGRRVVLLASCRDPKQLEPRLCDNGRFDLLIPVSPPDANERVAILRHLTARMLCAETTAGARRREGGQANHSSTGLATIVDGGETRVEAEEEDLGLLDEVARRTHGFVGADLVRLCREAAVHAARRAMSSSSASASASSVPVAAARPPHPPNPPPSFSSVVVTANDFNAALTGPHAQPSYLLSGSAGSAGSAGSGSGGGGGGEAAHVPQDPRLISGSKDISQLGGALQREWRRLDLAVVGPLKAAAAAAGAESRVTHHHHHRRRNDGRQKSVGGGGVGVRSVSGGGGDQQRNSMAALLRSLGISSPRGVLISGPPGAGKTALALALARACAPNGVRFLNVSCNSLVRAEIGSSEKALASVFSAARRASPCLVLLDQVEIIAGRRNVPAAGGGGDSGGDASSSTENTMDRLLSLLLVEVDGVLTGSSASSGCGGGGDFLSATSSPEPVSSSGGGGATVVLIGTTQDRSTVEPALLRPGRLDQHICLSCQPDLADRKDILGRLLASIPLELGEFRTSSDHLSAGAPLPHPPLPRPLYTNTELEGSKKSAFCTEEETHRIPNNTGGAFEAFVAWLAEATEALSGAALERLCQEAAIECLRQDIRAQGVRREYFEVALGEMPI
eukprot:CAMPEP_0171919172 /NCGR_PEP_ID=MMETSP0993-20121228/17820_1 /TAXON_ID=483369 /ORGANISM="non described non described, Strain CCMP2098" /LENGTH=745 /DNA_ID=CAMNT_0012555725 /DNA_START=74 /DNA_END=2311 /DNA_ORIENTATION=-